MKTRLLLLLSATVLTAALLSISSGCAWSIGGSKGNAASTTPTQPPTRGQELIDLQKAHDAGAISDEEYERMKQRVMDE